MRPSWYMASFIKCICITQWVARVTLRARSTLNGHPEVKSFPRFWLTQSSQTTPFAAYETRIGYTSSPTYLLEYTMESDF